MTIDARVEMFYDGAYQDITPDVDMRQPITVGYGQPDEHGESNPTDIALRLLNTDAGYSPKDPRSELFDKIGVSTPLRVRIGDPQPMLELFGVQGANASTPAHASLDITGDLDGRIEITPATWRPATSVTLVAKYGTNDGARSWALLLTSTGLLQLLWTTDGTVGDRRVRSSSAAILEDSGRLAIKWTLNVDDAGDHTVTFYTSDSISGTWIPLGDPVTQAGITSIFAGDADLEIGTANDGGIPAAGVGRFVGRVHALELRNGIDGTVVASPDFGTQDASVTSFDDAAGRTWTVNGTAHIADPSLLGSCEITSWVPGWDETAVDAVIDAQAAGILERLSQGEEALRSSLFRDLSTKDNVVAYYPLEEGKDASRLLSGLQNDAPSLAITGSVTLGAFTDFAASDALPTIDEGHIRGGIAAYVGAADQRFITLTAVPADGIGAGITRLLFRLWTTTGAVRRWDVVINSDGNLSLEGYSETNALVFTSVTLSAEINGKLGMVSLWLSQNGADVDWQVSFFEVGASGGVVIDGSQATTYGHITGVQVGDARGMNGTAYGHLTVINDDVHSIWDVILNSLVAWSGETAVNRFIRLAGEEDIPLVVASDPAESVNVGAQDIAELLSLFGDAARAELGFFGEQRDDPALRVRGHASLFHQAPRLELDMDDGYVTNPFEPPLDNQGVRNDVTVERVGGAKYRAVKTTGALNVNSPRDDPQGAGRHKSSHTLNLAADSQLRGQAHWRVHLGTVDQHRIAALEIELEHHPELVQAVLEMQQGDLVRLTNPLAGLPPEDIDLLVLGWRHHITNQTWHVTINLAPAAPWNTAVIGSSKVNTVASETAAGFTAGTDTTLSVASGVFEGFEEPEELLPIAEGSWERTTTSPHSGSQCLRSSPSITHDGISDVHFNVPAGMRTLTFWYRVSSESGFDFFRFYIDSVEQFSASGEVPWTQSATYRLFGASTVAFRYAKDVDTSSGEDAAFVDDISFQAGALWTTDAAHMPIDIRVAGVVLRATAIAGSESPQTFTVEQQPINGVTKAIAAGEAVNLATPAPVRWQGGTG